MNHTGLSTLIMIDMYTDIHEQLLGKTNFLLLLNIFKPTIYFNTVLWWKCALSYGFFSMDVMFGYLSFNGLSYKLSNEMLMVSPL